MGRPSGASLESRLWENTYCASVIELREHQTVVRTGRFLRGGLPATPSTCARRATGSCPASGRALLTRVWRTRATEWRAASSRSRMSRRYGRILGVGRGASMPLWRTLRRFMRHVATRWRITPRREALAIDSWHTLGLTKRHALLRRRAPRGSLRHPTRERRLFVPRMRLLELRMRLLAPRMRHQTPGDPSLGPRLRQARRRTPLPAGHAEAAAISATMRATSNIAVGRGVGAYCR